MDSLNAILKNSKEFIGNKEKADILLNLSEYYLLINNNEKTGDSLGFEALILAEKLNSPNQTLKYFNRFLTLKSARNEWNLTTGILAKTEEVISKANNSEAICRAYILLSDYNLYLYNIQNAKNFCSKAMEYAQKAKSEALIIQCHLAIGNCYNKELEKVDAFQEYATAVTKSEKLENPKLIIECYDYLASFYKSINVNEKAKSYLRKKLTKLANQVPVDSNEIVKVWIEFEQMEFNPDFTLDKNSRTNRIFKYADRHENYYIKSLMLSICRGMFIDQKRIDQLNYIYKIKYPQELETLKKTEYINYLRLQALFYEYDHEIDSAQYYYIKAEKEVLKNVNKALISKFYFRYGQFFERQKDYGLSVLMFKKSIDYANKAKIPSFALEASEGIENLFYKNGEFKEAYQYGMINHKLSNQINNLALKDDLMSLEIKNTTKLQDLAFEKQELANKISLEKEQTRKYIFLFSGVLFFMFSIGLFSRLRFIRKSRLELSNEKDKSDNLLLNILPKRVANELKEKGRFEPRAFTQATVLFTDFQNFTPLSATVPVTELIEEVDICFKAFDGIIEKYNLEKIKTIGDSYMAASGLAKNQTVPPDNAIRAGLEMQAFIETRKSKRDQEKSIAFQMRLGLHTGPVIAGIVGAKKFQYDIWGDTVNIASRMESYGVVGRVNISDTSFLLVENKEKFVFSSRGNISVKGKGEMEMFFVEDINNIKKYSLEEFKENSQKAQLYILKRLKTELPSKLKYHSVNHTLGLLNSVKELVDIEKIDPFDLELLYIAAAYHDSGFLFNYNDHEEASCNLVDEQLPKFGFNLNHIAEIKEMIQSTKIPQKPKNHLAKILCDADLYYLGGKQYYEIANLLKEELTSEGFEFTAISWLNFQINFLKEHQYFTQIARDKREEHKSEILKELISKRGQLEKNS